MARAGRMRVRVRFDSRSTSKDSAGQPVDTWTEVATVWAEKRDLLGREFYGTAERNALLPTEFRIRYLAGLSPKMRAVCDSRTYNVISVQDPTGIKRDLIVYAEEIVA